MATYDDIVERDASLDPLVPTPVAAQVIQELPAASAVMAMARKVPMSTKSLRTPVLSVLPTAYFVNGDSGLKQTTAQDWENVVLVAEEIAALVPVPLAYLDDAQVPIWDEVRPRIVEAIGAKIDAAALFGVELPSTWGDAIVTHATAAGNTVAEGTGDDIGVDIAALAELVALDGFNVNGFAVQPGFNWRLVQLRSGDGVPIYSPLAGAQPATLFGEMLPQVRNGAWDPDEASLIAGDWSKAIVGTRQDITFEPFRAGVITDDDGTVVYNAMQQDGVVFRAVMRLGWQLANPATRQNPTEGTRSPFGVLTPAAS